MSNIPSMTEHSAKVASPTICQLKRNQPRPRDVAAPAKSKTFNIKWDVKFLSQKNLYYKEQEILGRTNHLLSFYFNFSQNIWEVAVLLLLNGVIYEVTPLTLPQMT
jgi:hypothetical protein